MSRRILLFLTSLGAGCGVILLLGQLSERGLFPTEHFGATALCLLLATLGAGLVGPILCERAAAGWGFLGTLVFSLALAGMAATALFVPRQLPDLAPHLTLMLMAELSVGVVGLGVVRAGLLLMSRQVREEAAESAEQ